MKTQLKETVLERMPVFLKRAMRVRRDRKHLATFPRLDCDTEGLQSIAPAEFGRVFQSRDMTRNWTLAQARIKKLQIIVL